MTQTFLGAPEGFCEVLALQVEVYVSPQYRGIPHYLAALRAYKEARYDLADLSVVSRRDDGSIECLDCLDCLMAKHSSGRLPTKTAAKSYSD